jgi:hypothetical protein
MLQVDLRAPGIAPTQRVWRLFPGRGYKFLEFFARDGVGYLDFPGLVLPKGNLAQVKDWIPRIARSQAVADTLRKLGPDAKFDLPLSQFEKARTGKNRGRFRQGLINFFQEAKSGDFVVLPEPVFMSRIWVGVLEGNDPVSAFYPRFGKTAIPARPIKWLNRFPENSVSTDLSQSLRNQHPFTLIERSLFVEVISLAFGSFVYGDRHVATVYNDLNDFLDSDAALLGAISRLAAAALQSVDEQKAGIDHDLVSLLLRSPPIEYTCTQESDIHSEGFTRYISATPVALVIAAVAAALIGYSQLNSKSDLAKELPQLQFSNTAPNADPACTAKVSQASKMVLEALNIDRTWALCEAARAAAARAGLRSSAQPSKK